MLKRHNSRLVLNSFVSDITEIHKPSDSRLKGKLTRERLVRALQSIADAKEKAA